LHKNNNNKGKINLYFLFAIRGEKQKFETKVFRGLLVIIKKKKKPAVNAEFEKFFFVAVAVRLLARL
jgi:hypothetical protein